MPPRVLLSAFIAAASLCLAFPFYAQSILDVQLAPISKAELPNAIEARLNSFSHKTSIRPFVNAHLIDLDGDGGLDLISQNEEPGNVSFHRGIQRVGKKGLLSSGRFLPGRTGPLQQRKIRRDVRKFHVGNYGFNSKKGIAFLQKRKLTGKTLSEKLKQASKPYSKFSIYDLCPPTGICESPLFEFKAPINYYDFTATSYGFVLVGSKDICIVLKEADEEIEETYFQRNFELPLKEGQKFVAAIDSEGPLGVKGALIFTRTPSEAFLLHLDGRIQNLSASFPELSKLNCITAVHQWNHSATEFENSKTDVLIRSTSKGRSEGTLSLYTKTANGFSKASSIKMSPTNLYVSATDSNQDSLTDLLYGKISEEGFFWYIHEAKKIGWSELPSEKKETSSVVVLPLLDGALPTMQTPPTSHESLFISY